MSNIAIFTDGKVEVDFLEEDLIKPIKHSLKNLQLIDENIKNIDVGVIFNKRFPNYRKDFESPTYEIFEYNSPTMDGKQYNLIREFIKSLKGILQNQNPIKLKEAGVETISLMLLYNDKIEKKNIKGLKLYSSDTQNKESEEFVFTPVKPKFKLSQVVMRENLKKEIEKTLTILEKRELIYEKWGFAEIDPAPKAILNFYGASGTGKTMTAHAIANHLGVDILALNYADIESKYVGDAPKNLVKAFESAKEKKALLFFDEADSFLGKRITNISSSSDQAVNSLRSQLLILLENFDGIVIFATNLIKNYDKAFESRIFKHIKFELPDTEYRKEIIQKLTPQKVPFENDNRFSESELEELAEITDGFSGREIKNGVLNALSSAALSNREYLTFDDFKEAFEEIAKSKKDIKNENSSGGISLKRKRALEDKIKSKLKNRKTKKYKTL